MLRGSCSESSLEKRIRINAVRTAVSTNRSSICGTHITGAHRTSICGKEKPDFDLRQGEAGLQSAARRTEAGLRSAARSAGLRSAARSAGLRSAVRSVGLRSAARSVGLRSAARGFET
ncbi:hypothetical protein VIGAN_08251500 [Vigna angularis var. angularis]|uniref:Uncharacterized protein n=1 Tax=Vigna angularis var. angularis TaxID=157739 RepID=A0A0S3SSD2_PHAAN|nr:hypothetical protein VIGAN_08251500 [Vigna angularis var. angularis]